MKISSKGIYALEAMVELASRNKEDYVSIREIAKSRNGSIKYLEQIFNLLKVADLVFSVRGKGGGYKLNKSAALITAKDIIVAVEGELNPVFCLSAECSRAELCKTKPVWAGMQKVIYDVLENKTLEELAEKYTQAKQNSF